VPTLVQSVQRGAITLPDGTASATATITAVDPLRTVVRSLGFSATAPVTTAAENTFAVVLTNATTVTGSRQTGGSPASEVIGSYEAIQYAPGVIKSIQVGTVTILNGNLSATAMITQLSNLSRTQIEVRGKFFDNAIEASANNAARVVLTDNVTVTATRTGSSGELIISFTVVEFY